MERKYKIGIISLILIIFILFLNSTGFLVILNYPLTAIIAGEPDKSCSVDSDCVWGKPTCAFCDCGEPLNMNWRPFCPFKSLPALCSPCLSSQRIICSDNICKVPETKEELSEMKDVLLSEWDGRNYNAPADIAPITEIKTNEFNIKEGVGAATFIAEVYNSEIIDVNIAENITCRVISGEGNVLSHLFYHGFKCYSENGPRKDCNEVITEEFGNVRIAKEIRLSPQKKAQIKLVFYNTENRLVYTDTSVVCDTIISENNIILDSNQLTLHFKG